MTQTLRLPATDGGLQTYTLRGSPPATPAPGLVFTRIAYSAAHVVADPMAAIGDDAAGYVNLITGPRAADEADGPEEFHLVLAGGKEFEEAIVRCLAEDPEARWMRAADLAAIEAVTARSSGPLGDVYTLERDRTGRHGSIMKYELNAVDDSISQLGDQLPNSIAPWTVRKSGPLK